MQNLYDLVHAIINKKLISLDYRSFSQEEENRLVLEPYALKEFKYRWYLLANVFQNGEVKLKSYGLDRISNLEIKNSTFKRKKVDIAAEYHDLFGIVSKNEHALEKVILSFDPHQGQYIKSLPLHHSQETLIDNDKELRIQLHIYPPYDFKQEIFSYGNRLKVIAPESYRKEIQAEIAEIL